MEKVETLNQRIVTYYRFVKKNSLLFRIGSIVILLISILLFILFFVNNTQYQAKNQLYERRLNTLKAERADIEAGKIQIKTKSFDTILQENLGNLKDYPQEEDNYTVSINGTDGQLSINRNNTFISDNAGMLNKKTKQTIYQLNKQLAAATNGAQLMVVTIPELPSGEDIDTYAEKIFNQLGIGDADEKNGVLYLIALDDQKFRLEVGYGLEGLIPDGKAGDIINNDNVVDNFKDEKYDAAVSQVVEQVFGLMNTKTALVDSKIQKIQSQKNTAVTLHWVFCITLWFIGLLCLFFIISSLRGKKVLNDCYRSYFEQMSAHRNTAKDVDALLATMRQTELYYVMLSGISIVLSAKGVLRAIKRGRLLKNPLAKRMSFGRILIDDTLYSGNGDVLTTFYLTSNYNSSNWSSNNSSSGGDSGGSSWGSFGGGSSGGGGASGGW
ncbi:TPM domain-containing protein [Erwinia sp. CPCC 100877]|nr:TPM domain-containing protein [Erwinia sp. CPCC 100877]